MKHRQYIQPGTRFSRLTVVSREGKYLSCICDCGTIKSVRIDHLNAGRIKSCGCLAVETARAIHTKHGESFTRAGAVTPEYRSWRSMLNRCNRASDISYPLYGGRGIKVCERWLSYENFLADMGRRPPKTSIDRINTNGNYEPANCRWATSVQQMNNRRPFSEWRNSRRL